MSDLPSTLRMLFLNEWQVIEDHVVSSDDNSLITIDVVVCKISLLIYVLMEKRRMCIAIQDFSQ